MSEEDFDALYKLLRGTSTATSIVDALSLYREGNDEASLALLKTAEASYRSQRQATIRKDLTALSEEDKSKLSVPDRRILKAQEKVLEALERVSKLQELLEKRIARKKPAPSVVKPSAPITSQPNGIVEKPAAVASSTTQSNPVATAPKTIEKLVEQPPAVAMVSDSFPAEFVAKHDKLTSSRDALQLAKQYFRVTYLDEAHTPSPGNLYLVQAGEQNFCFVRSSNPAVQDGQLEFATAIDNKRIKPLALEKFVKASAAKRIVGLELSSARAKQTDDLPKESIVPAAQEQTTEAKPQSQSSVNESHRELSDEELVERDMVLDMGAFSQLIDSAQRCGLVSGISNLIQLRDCEFRQGRYPEALQALESIFSAFTGAVANRTAQLKREDLDIANGKLKLSPRELQAKRAKDQAGNENIERARTRFSRVLDGLRLLIHNAESAKK